MSLRLGNSRGMCQVSDGNPGRGMYGQGFSSRGSFIRERWDFSCSPCSAQVKYCICMSRSGTRPLTLRRSRRTGTPTMNPFCRPPALASTNHSCSQEVCTSGSRFMLHCAAQMHRLSLCTELCPRAWFARSRLPSCQSIELLSEIEAQSWYLERVEEPLPP